MLDRNNTYTYPSKGLYKLRTTLRGCSPVYKEVEIKSAHRIYPIRSDFQISDGIPVDQLSHLPLKSIFGSPALVPKSDLTIVQFMSGALLAAAVVYGVIEQDWREDVMPIPILGLSEMMYWQFRQRGKYDSQTGRFVRSDYHDKNWRISFNFSTYKDISLDQEKKVTLVDQFRTRCQTIRFSGFRDYTISVGIERRFSPYFYAGIDISYYPGTEVQVDFLDTLKYGQTEIPFIYTQKTKKEILFLNLDINIVFARFLSQEISLTLGGFLGTPFKFSKDFILRQYATIDIFDTIAVSYAYEPYGLTSGITVLSPISERIGFQFKTRFYYPVAGTLSEEKKGKLLMTWHAGFYHQL